ncbi:hypothetical protein [Nocardia sp. NPDC057272]
MRGDGVPDDVDALIVDALRFEELGREIRAVDSACPGCVTPTNLQVG